MTRTIGAGLPGIIRGWGLGPRKQNALAGVLSISASASSFSNAATIGTVIATLSSTDSAPGATFTYTIPSGGNPSGYFAIVGNQINITQGAVPDGTYTLKVRSTDNANNFMEKTFSFTSQTVYSTEAQTLFNNMTVQPNATRKGQIETLITNLKTHGLWDMMDLFYMMAAHDSQASLLNWKDPAGAFNLTGVGSPVFTVDRGWVGVTSSGKLDTGWNPTAQTGKLLSAGDCSVHGYVQVVTNTTITRIMGASGLDVSVRTSLKGTVAVGNASGITYAGATTATQGFFQGRRIPANVGQPAAWLNLGSSGALTTQATGSLPNATLNICGQGGASANGVGGHQCRFFAVGKGTDDTQTTNMYNDVLAYLTAVGANLTTNLV